MIILDTNHTTELAYRTVMGDRLRHRLLEAGMGVFTTTVTVEEELRGVLAKSHRSRNADELILAQAKLMERVNFFARWAVLPLDKDSLARFADLRKNGIRIGTQDLRIACITLAHDAILLTRNSVDFSRVPGLHFENWLV